ncbi:MAG: hypothetical protein LBB88_07415, partial [Planctomycetaceae bacterium]|nr:hypothetical protein [Planctomycetaceae bacterium]
MTKSIDRDKNSANKLSNLLAAKPKLSLFDNAKKREEFAEYIAEMLTDIGSTIVIDPDNADSIFQILAHSHDLLCRSVLKNIDVATNFFENHIDPKIA